jgi:hypothetical protein
MPTGPERCHSCGATGNTSNRRLLECGECNVTLYCSVPCQRTDWRYHKKICKIACKFPPELNKLNLDGEEADLKNYDTILDYASENMVNLKHLEITTRQESILDVTGTSSTPKGKITLTAKTLEAFLKKRKLESVCFTFATCRLDQIREMTDSGKVFIPLKDNEYLTHFSACYPVFGRADVLAKSIASTNLKVLSLSCMTLGGGTNMNPPASWPRQETTVLISAISRLPNLVKLCLDDCYFKDSDLEPLLSNLTKLKHLGLSGNFAGRTGSYLTDRGFETIARVCPNLQCLYLGYHHQATTQGVQAILQKCTHLRELDVSRVKIPMTDLKTILPYSTTLLFIRLGTSFPTHDRTEKEHLKEAVIATRGRVLLLFGEMRGPLQLPEVSPDYRRQYEHSLGLVKEASRRLKEDPSVCNEWEWLFTG